MTKTKSFKFQKLLKDDNHIHEETHAKPYKHWEN